MQEIIVKKSHTGQPVVFLVDSYDTGRVKAFVDNEEKTLSIDYYNLAKPLAPEDAQKAIEAYRQHAKLPAEEIFVRHRLPKNYANLLPKATQASAVDEAAELSGSIMAQQMAEAVQNRKNRRSEAAKKRYEAEMAATAAQAGNVAVSAAKTNGATASPQASQQERNNDKQLANVIAKAVASAVAEALKAIH